MSSCSSLFFNGIYGTLLGVSQGPAHAPAYMFSYRVSDRMNWPHWHRPLKSPLNIDQVVDFSPEKSRENSEFTGFENMGQKVFNFSIQKLIKVRSLLKRCFSVFLHNF